MVKRLLTSSGMWQTQTAILFSLRAWFKLHNPIVLHIYTIHYTWHLDIETPMTQVCEKSKEKNNKLSDASYFVSLNCLCFKWEIN